MRIQLLDESTSNRIAAGEVVERPSSVVKELLENALDAGANSISIEIVSGGLSMIRIVDNGSGIHPDDLPLAFMRHATGKIRSGDSLMAIETMGFRGEALSSIAAVARVTLTSRQKGAELGACISLEGGKVLEQSAIGCPEGTSLTVKDLFFNTPARLKFVKSPAAEAARVSDVVLRAILANPEVSIRLVSNHKTIYHSPGSGLKDAIISVYGKQVERQLLPVEYASDSIKIKGYIGAQELSRQTHAGQTLMVNGRVIQIKLLAEAVQKGYGQTLMIGRFPFFVLHLQMPFANVDVNVHPQKVEVRFADPLLISENMTTAVEQALILQKSKATAKENAPTNPFLYATDAENEEKEIQQISLEQQSLPQNIENGSPATNAPEASTVDYTQHTLSQSKEKLSLGRIPGFLNFTDTLKEDNGIMTWTGIQNQSSDQGNQTVSQDMVAERTSLGEHPIVLGQLFETYLLVQSQDLLYIIDQHAGHERLTYDAYKQQIEISEIASQPMLVPDILTLTYSEMLAFQQHQDVFKNLGFDATEFGEKEIIIRSYPLVLGKVALQVFFTDVLDHILNQESVTMNDLVMDKLIRSACRHSIKAGDPLGQKEMETLVKRLQKQENLTCPHGRPIAIRISKTDLEKRFGRLV